MSWLITATHNAFIADADARAYVNAVEQADRQTLEPAVTQAIVDFVAGCKADGIWGAIKASCILAGARTLAGALVPLAGPVPTNVGGGFIDSDYNRKTGLRGAATDKSLDSNRNTNADGQDDSHLSIYCTDIGGASGNVIGSSTINASGASAIVRASNARIHTRSRNATVEILATNSFATGYIGHTRNASLEYSVLTKNSVTAAETSVSVTQGSQTPFNGNIIVLTGGTQRIAYYSIGSNIDLALHSRRVATLISSVNAAIP
jgi:hypothetical protein